MTLRIGLTGSIGMGKSTTAQLFRDAGCAVWDADAAVAAMYAKDGAAVEPLGEKFPDAIKDGTIDKASLREILQKNPSHFDTLNAIVHPLVQLDRDAFSVSNKGKTCVFDIPLLFENNSEDQFDLTVCVLTDADTQRQRVLARGTMTEDDLNLIVSRQLPAETKANRADFVICTDTMDTARRDVELVLAAIRDRS